jgi:beta-glucosidase
VSAAVTNVAGRPGTEVAQLYVAVPGGPPAQLKGIHKLRLASGETARAEFSLPREALATYDDGWVVRPGRYGIMVGRSARDLRLRADLDLERLLTT